MDYMGRTTTTISAPASGPMDLSAGKPDWRELAPLFGLILLSLLPVGLGGALTLACWPEYQNEMNGWRTLGISTGGLLAFGGGSFFWTLRKAVLQGIARYYARVDDWHYAQLDKYEQNGQIVAHQVAEWQLITTDARHVLLLLLYVYLSGKAPSINSLTEGPLLVKAAHRSFSLGKISQDSAASFCDLLARSTVVTGRAERVAGRLAPLDFRQACQRVLTELSRDPRVMEAPIE